MCKCIPAALGLLLLTGCGYQQSGNYNQATQGAYQWHSLYREDVQTIAVPIFGNREYRRGVEFGLTKAIINQIEAHSPYKVVPRERADTVLEGEITHVQVTPLSRLYREAIPQEQLVVMSVDFKWRDLRTGRLLLERKAFEQTAAYYPTLGEGEFVGDQQTIEKLAVAIARELQADW